MNHTQFKQIRQKHKLIQKLAQELKSDLSREDRIFVRHWNVFYNQVRGYNMNRIEKSSHTQLYSFIIQYLGHQFGLELDEIKTSYSTKGDWSWRLQYSDLAKKTLGGKK